MASLGWSAVAQGASSSVTATQDVSFELVCLAQIDSLGFRGEANYRVDIHSKKLY